MAIPNVQKVSGSSDEAIKIWDVQSGKVLKTLIRHEDSVCSVAISQDSKLIVSGSDDKAIRIWRTIVDKENYQIK